MGKKAIIIGFVSGAAVGAAAALLFAPQKGKYLRADISRKATKTADDVNEYIRDAAARATESVKGVLKKTTDLG
jgi:gas vesicle protein